MHRIINTKTSIMINEVILKRMNSGRIFTVQFVKKDGSIRVMNCRSGVKKYAKGVGLAFDPIKKGLYPVYDVQKEAYRFINMKTIKKIWIDKNIYDFE